MIIRSEERGVKFIGYTGEKICQKCKNNTAFIFYQSYLAQSLYYFIHMPTMHGKIKLNCSICENEEKLNYLSKEELHEYVEENLLNGKVFTKSWYQKQSVTKKDEYIKQLSRIRQNKMILYLGDY